MSINIKEILYTAGRNSALSLQARASEMTDTELCEEDTNIPLFSSAIKNTNMLSRDIGFVCKSPSGRIVRLIQKYDSSIYTNAPEDLPAQWGFAWSKNTAKALPFISLATSPYMKDDCCVYDDIVFRSAIDNNVWSPADYPAGWIVANKEA